MVGQINVTSIPADKGEKMFLNVYANSFGESQYNIHFRKVGKRVANLFAAHMVQPAMKWDRDKDRFLEKHAEGRLVP